MLREGRGWVSQAGQGVKEQKELTNPAGNRWDYRWLPKESSHQPRQLPECQGGTNLALVLSGFYLIHFLSENKSSPTSHECSFMPFLYLTICRIILPENTAGVRCATFPGRRQINTGAWPGDNTGLSLPRPQRVPGARASLVLLCVWGQTSDCGLLSEGPEGKLLIWGWLKKLLGYICCRSPTMLIASVGKS